VRSALLGAIAAVAAVVSAVVFNASLAGLISHPARYGWNWDTVIQAESGYGVFAPGAMATLLGKKIGDTVRIGVPPYTRTVVITGTVTLPSFGVGAADHVSLGRGAIVPLAAPRRSEPRSSTGSPRPTRTVHPAAPISCRARSPRRSSTPSSWAGSRSRSASAWPRRLCCR